MIDEQQNTSRVRNRGGTTDERLYFASAAIPSLRIPMPARRNAGMLLAGAVLALSAALAALFLWRFQLRSSVALGADAWSYAFFAFRFREYGLLHDYGSIRTYGYPLFLYVVSFASGFSEQRLALFAGAAQYGLLVVVTLALARQLRAVSGTLALAVLVGVLLNPLALGLVTDTLTEGLSLPLYLLLVTVAVRLHAGGQVEARWLFLGAAAAAFATMVRPANVVLFLAWHLAIVAWLLTGPSERRGRLLLTALACGLGATLLVWGPQLAYNWRSYGTATPLPVCNLGAFQIAYSIAAWKYDTLVVGGSAAGGWFYVNPMLDQRLPADVSMLWYLKNPVAGAATLLAHVFSSFSVTSPFTYLWDLRPRWDLAVRILYWASHALGALCILLSLGRLRRTTEPVRSALRWLPAGFAALSVAGVVALNSITAVEVRFNVIPITVLAVLGTWLVLDLLRGQRRLSSPALLATALLASAGVAGSYALDRLGQSSIEQQLAPYDLSGARCFLTGNAQSRPWADVLADYRQFMTRRGGAAATSR